VSARRYDDLLYRDELRELRDSGVEILLTLTRSAAPPAWPDALRGRINAEMLVGLGPGPGAGAHLYVCGPTPFVEEAARLLVELGHDPRAVRTERFGPTGV
jgi:ferredoxin-NADP reductase